VVMVWPHIPHGITDKLFTIASEAAPEEACGLLWYERGVSGTEGHWYIEPLENLATDKTGFFALDSQIVFSYSDRPNLAVYHSHPQGPAYPSFTDMAQQQACQLPYFIISLKPRSWFWVGAEGAYDLQDRPYRHGSTDCYALIRDWYRSERSIHLAEYPRAWNWWHEGADMYQTYFAKTGFVPLEAGVAPEIGDVFLARIRSPVWNHAGLYIGGGRILHHPAGSKGFDVTRRPKTEPVLRWHHFIDLWIRWKGTENV